MANISLKAGGSTCEILVENGLASTAGEFLREKYPDAKFVIVTDENVLELYPAHFKGSDEELILTVPAGEESKDMRTVEELARKMLDFGITRKDVVIGIGGGMITDLAGFLASVYMRGMRYVSMPTSLLAMVDAAIGGKTGVNLVAKNSVGTFHLAEYVLIDPSFLGTLPQREMQSGLGEVIKYAYSLDPSIIEDLDPMNSEAVIEKSVKAKANIVEGDFKEGDLRKLFNYGHTFGHAIEAKSHFNITHGEAVAIGMAISDHIARKMSKQSEETGKTILETLKKFNLPTELPEDQKIEELFELMLNDKKRSGETIDFIILKEFGDMEIIPLKPAELIEMAKDFG